jgi:putative Holliday junction resolvase
VSGRGERVLGIDPGGTRIGLALTDPLGIVARPLEVLSSAGARADVARIVDLVREHAVERVVIGLPLLMTGEEGTGAAAARRLAGRLRARLPEVAVELWDERLTTVEAERTLIAADVGRRKRRRVVDGVAAVLILQSYLDAHAARQGSTS